MKLLGHITTVAHDGNLVARAGFAPGPGTRVVDGRKRRIGRVVRVFGPCYSPYVTIKPQTGLRALAMIGQELYVPPEGEHGKNKRRDGADRKMPRVQQLPSGQRL